MSALEHEILLKNEVGQAGSVTYVIDSGHRLVVATFRQTVTVADIQAYTRRLQADPSFQPNFSEIADLRSVEHLDLQADEFLKLADEVDPFSYEAKRAFVVCNSVQSHAARMHKVLRTQRQFEIFHSREEAEQWIMT